MARIAVLASHQQDTDQPFRFVKKSAGQTLVRRALAYWIIENALLKMLPAYEPCKLAHQSPLYIPPKMPPAEIGGVLFEDPARKPGYEQHQPRFTFLSQRERSMQFEL